MYIPQSASTRYRKTQEYMAMSSQINFHRVAINDIKQRLGTACTYLSHLVKSTEVQLEIENEDGEKETVNKTIDVIYFLAHLIINGEKRIVRVNTGITAEELVAENYKALLTQLADYVTGKKNI
jgi:hypothetical protein